MPLHCLAHGTAGRYDGDVYNGLLERAQWSPLNRSDVLPLFEKAIACFALRPCRQSHTFLPLPHPHRQIIKTNRAGFDSELASKL